MPQQVTKEYDVSDLMTRKHRVTDTRTMRNLIPIAINGDKPYKDPSRSIGFYAQSGLIPGSTFSGRSTKSIKSQQQAEEKPLRKIASLTALERRTINIINSDQDQVLALTVSNELLNTYVAYYFHSVKIIN
jgi:hypothetical protein